MRMKTEMKNILFALLILVASLGYSCATIDAPAEPASTDTLENRVEPKDLENKYNPEVEEEIESDISPLETEMQEDQPLFK